MHNLLSDKDLIEGCKNGKRSYQDVLYQRYAPVLLGVCMRYIGNRMQAEDVLHDALIKIYISIKKFNITDNGSFEGWLKRITVNTALTFLRDNQKNMFHVDLEDANLAETERDEYFEKEEEPVDKTVLLKIIQELPKGYGLVFNMYVFENYSHQEIAETLEISLSTSKTQLLKARNYIKKKVFELKKNTIAISA